VKKLDWPGSSRQRLKTIKHLGDCVLYISFAWHSSRSFSQLVPETSADGNDDEVNEGQVIEPNM